jgi:hypothetical protein
MEFAYDIFLFSATPNRKPAAWAAEKEPGPKWYTDCVIAFANGLNSSVDFERDEAGKREPLCN